MIRSFLAVIFLLLTNCINAQQNSTLFFMQSTPQANFVNPAVRNECQWMLGLPVISSLHFEFGNSISSLMGIMSQQADGTYVPDSSKILNSLGRANYINTEFHTNLFFLSLWHKDKFFTFSVNEKVDLFMTAPRDLIVLGWGNSQFEGKHADLSRLGLFLNYRREYAFGVAKEISNDLILGIRAKLLFGKLNTSMPQSSMDLFTAPTTFDLVFTNNLKMNTSLPMTVQTNPNGTVQNATFNGSVGSILMNRSNVGLAFDLGFIKYRNDEMTVSGSILDLGLIRWSSGYSFTQNGQYTYHGPIGDTIPGENYLDNLSRIIKNEFGITATPKSYISFLIPTYYLGATYKLRDDLNAGAVVSGKISRYRVTSGMTLSLNKNFNQKAAVSISWSYLYKSFKNFGAGVKLGKSPVQFYAVSDNVLGLIKPLDTKNINLRFGLQLNFGCQRKEKVSNNCGCAWLKYEEERHKRERKKLKKKTEY